MTWGERTVVGLSGWLEGQENDIDLAWEIVVANVAAHWINFGWSRRNVSQGGRRHLFFGGVVRPEELDWFVDQVRAMAGVADPGSPDQVRGLFVGVDAAGAACSYQVMGREVTITSDDRRFGYLRCRIDAAPARAGVTKSQAAVVHRPQSRPSGGNVAQPMADQAAASTSLAAGGTAVDGQFDLATAMGDCARRLTDIRRQKEAAIDAGEFAAAAVIRDEEKRLLVQQRATVAAWAQRAGNTELVDEIVSLHRHVIRLQAQVAHLGGQDLS